MNPLHLPLHMFADASYLGGEIPFAWRSRIRVQSRNLVSAHVEQYVLRKKILDDVTKVSLPKDRITRVTSSQNAVLVCGSEHCRYRQCEAGHFAKIFGYFASLQSNKEK